MNAMGMPPGWYPQPDGSYRYFDGAAWTNFLVPPEAVRTIGMAGADYERHLVLEHLARMRDTYFREAAEFNQQSRRGDAMIEAIWQLEANTHRAPPPAPPGRSGRK